MGAKKKQKMEIEEWMNAKILKLKNRE
jgi:hypothetical protein